MSTEQTTEEGTEEAGRGPKSFAELCQSMMTAEKGERCGGRMQEMMSRCMAAFANEQEDTN